MRLFPARPVHVNKAQKVLGNLTSTAILTSSLMLSPDSFLVVTRSQTSQVNRREFAALMDSLGIRMAIEDKNGVQDLYIVKHQGQTKISNVQDNMPMACYPGPDGTYLATTLMSVTEKVRSVWRKLLSLSKLLPQMKLLSKAGSCIEDLDFSNLNLAKLYGCTKVVTN